MKDWKELLVSEAKGKHMCTENFRSLLECGDKETAIELYKKTIDWALEEEYPSLGVICDCFSDCEEYGIFVGKVLDGQDMSTEQVYVLHACTGTVDVAMDYDNAVIPMIYIANGCDIQFRCHQHNIIPINIPIYVFGDNALQICENVDGEDVIHVLDKGVGKVRTQNAYYRIYWHD